MLEIILILITLLLISVCTIIVFKKAELLVILSMVSILSIKLSNLATEYSYKKIISYKYEVIKTLNSKVLESISDTYMVIDSSRNVLTVSVMPTIKELEYNCKGEQKTYAYGR